MMSQAICDIISPDHKSSTGCKQESWKHAVIANINQ